MSAKGSTKEAILTTAIKLFNEHGFEQVTINQICKEIQVTKTTFYYHFKSKDELVSNYFSVENMVSNDELLNILTVTDYVEQVLEAMGIFVKHMVRSGVEMTKENYRIHLRNQMLPLDKSKSPLLSQIIPSLIQRAQDAGQIQNPASAEDLLDTMCNTANGVILNWAITGGSFDVLAEVRMRFEILLIVRRG